MESSSESESESESESNQNTPSPKKVQVTVPTAKATTGGITLRQQQPAQRGAPSTRGKIALMTRPRTVQPKVYDVDADE